jgi:hypothetical protein
MIYAELIELLEYLNVSDLNFCVRTSRKMAPWIVKKKE